MDYSIPRHNMVVNQLRPNRVTDDLIVEAMDDLPREAFVPREKAGIAYVDESIDLGSGRQLMEPMVQALLLQAAEVASSDLALDIGCGTGYASAVLSRLASAVVALESDPGLAAQAAETLEKLGIDTVSVVEGPLAEGYPRQAPYDVIFFNGAVSAVPAAVSGQLAEGGRLVCIVANGPANKGTLFTLNGGILSSRQVFDAGIPMLPEFAAQSAFVF